MTPEEIAAYKAQLLRQRDVGLGLMLSGSKQDAPVGQQLYQTGQAGMTPSMQNLGMGVLANQFGETSRPSDYMEAEEEARLFKRALARDKENMARNRPYEISAEEFDEETGQVNEVFYRVDPASGEKTKIHSALQAPAPGKVDKDAVESSMLADQWDEVIGLMEGTEGWAKPYRSAAAGVPADVVGVFNESIGQAMKDSAESRVYTPEQRDVHAARDRLVEITRRPETGANFTKNEERFLLRYMPSPYQSEDRQLRNARIVQRFLRMRATGEPLSLDQMNMAAGEDLGGYMQEQSGDDYQEGEILTNNAGERIILRNGQWVPYDGP